MPHRAGTHLTLTRTRCLPHGPDIGLKSYARRINFEVYPKKGRALIFFPGFMNGELDTDALHAASPAISTKWVSQVWIRQSFREDGQPSAPVRRRRPSNSLHASESARPRAKAVVPERKRTSPQCKPTPRCQYQSPSHTDSGRVCLCGCPGT